MIISITCCCLDVCSERIDSPMLCEGSVIQLLFGTEKTTIKPTSPAAISCLDSASDEHSSKEMSLTGLSCIHMQFHCLTVLLFVVTIATCSHIATTFSERSADQLRFSDFDSKVSRLLATPVFHFCLKEGVLVQIWMLRSYVCRPKGGLLGEILSSRHVEVN